MIRAIRSFLVLGATVVSALAVGLTPALASARTTPSVGGFFSGGNGNAHWSRTISNDMDPFSIQLSVPNNSSYAGFTLKHVGTSLPTEAPSFQFTETGSASGGAPRLVIASTNGCYAYEYSLTPYAAYPTFQTASQWDVYGTCGFHYNVAWPNVPDYFTGTVKEVYVVSDAYNGAHTDYIDNVSYNGTTLSQPSDNANNG